MSSDSVVVIARDGLQVAIMLCAPALGASLAVGLVVSFLQAVTQMQDQTLSFIPKMAAVAGALFFFGPWMLSVGVRFTHHAVEIMSRLGR